MDVSENDGTPKSSILIDLIGFSIINHPFGVPLFLETPKSTLAFLLFYIDFLQAQLFRIPGDGNPCLGSSVAVCTSPAKWTNVTWKGTIWNGNFIFQPSILGGYLSLGGVITCERPQEIYPACVRSSTTILVVMDLSMLILPRCWRVCRRQKKTRCRDGKD